MNRGISMFNNPAYMTKGFQSTIPVAVQLILFQLINDIKTSCNIDYLQIFELSTNAVGDVEMQRIIHKQEQPDLKRTYLFPVTSTVNAKVFVIDDGDHHTFLLAEEY